jgi:dimethylaniline monooxygenase (N-oxide forming)
LRDGDTLGVDCVILGTGWKSGYSFLSNEARETLGTDDDGFYLYPHMLHPDLPNLIFIGRTSTLCMSSEHFGQLAWQFKRTSGSSGLKVQAAIAC